MEPSGIMRLNGMLMRLAAAVTLVVGLWMGVTLGGAACRSAEAPLAFSEGELPELELQVADLSVAPPGSVADIYLALAGGEEGESE
jgi:hypothetical protein